MARSSHLNVMFARAEKVKFLKSEEEKCHAYIVHYKL
jgi:hypothetical protein